jgi:hypothetical protein
MGDFGLSRQVDDIRALIDAKLGIRGRTLDHQLRKAGRLLPRAVQRDAHYLAQASLIAQNPKLARMIDQSRVEAAFLAVVTHLKAIDRGDAIKGRLLGIAGILAFNALLIGGLLVAYLVWKGIV